MRHRSTIGTEQAKCDAPFILANFWPSTRQLDGSFIVVGDFSDSIGGINCCRQRIEDLPQLVILTPSFFPSRHQLGDVNGKAASTDKLAVTEMSARCDLYMLDRAVAGQEPGWVFV